MSLCFGLYRMAMSRNWWTPQPHGEAPVFTPIPVTAEFPDLEPSSEFRAIRKVKKGDTIQSIIAAYGFDKSVAQSISDSFDEFQKHQSTGALVKAGRTFTFSFDPKGKLVEVSSETAPGRILKFRRLASGKFLGALEAIEHIPRERIAIGHIESSFAAAAGKAGVSYDVVDDLVDLFSDRIEFSKDFHAGDRFTVIYRDLLTVDGRQAGNGQIVAAALEVNGETIVAARYVGSDGKARYFDEKGQLLGNAFLRYPLKFSRIASTFTTARFHPVLKITRPHNGVDFAAPIGTPVRAVADGYVMFSGRKPDTGNMVKIRHSAKYATAYLHLNSITPGVANGTHVRRGDVIGAVGMTGLATGPHLHFSFYEDGRYIDPLKIKLPTIDLLDPGTRINDNYLKMVLFTLKHYQTVDLAAQ